MPGVRCVQQTFVDSADLGWVSGRDCQIRGVREGLFIDVKRPPGAWVIELAASPCHVDGVADQFSGALIVLVCLPKLRFMEEVPAA